MLLLLDELDGAVAAVGRRPSPLRRMCRALVPLAALTASPMVHAGEDVSALLKEKTQEFSDAGQSGSGERVRDMVDDDVVFFNEGGDPATKADLTSNGPASGSGVKMTVSDWRCVLHGDVAVTSFVDQQDGEAHGQPIHARYRSVETWLKTEGRWRMIGSETIALQDDPTAITLPVRLLDQYVGSYIAGTDLKFTFVRTASGVTGSTNGGPATEQKAELADVLFTPGRARFRKIFQRDPAGRVVGFILRREGHDIVFRKI